MKCGDCETEMEEKKETRLGEKVLIYTCSACGKSLINLDDAIKIQRKFIKAIEEDRTVVKIGNSIGITFPRELKEIFKLGKKVKLKFDPDTMEISVRAK
ncbi:MAG: hypothetical protein V3R86_01900 [Candidatus Hydrothermarchaeaceae archaeon]